MSSETAFTAALAEHRAVAILRTDDRERAAAAMRAAVDAGFRVVEFTVTTPGALALIAEFSRDPRLTVGAGTVLTPEVAGEAVRAGARFLVSPVLDERVVACARALGVAAVPGCFTPTELWRAHEAGAAIPPFSASRGDSRSASAGVGAAARLVRPDARCRAGRPQLRPAPVERSRR